MNRFYILVLLLILHFSINAQVAIQWQNTIGGNLGDVLTSIAQTADEGFICGGWSSSNISGDKTENCQGVIDYWVVKLDLIGNIQWQNTFGGDQTDHLQSIVQTADGGYICGGWSSSNISGDKTENGQGSDDYWVVKLDAVGNIQWQNTIGGSGGDNLNSIAPTNDGGYICGGWSNSNLTGDKTENGHGERDYWVVKLDGTGNIQWQNTIGGSGDDRLYSISQTSDGGYICGGYSTSGISGDKTAINLGGYDYWPVKLDAVGNIQWQNTIGGNSADQLYSISQTADGGFICGGYSTSNISGNKTENSQGGYDYWPVKLDAVGNIQWQNTIGGSGTDYLLSIAQTTDGGYICGGNSNSNISGDKTENSRGGHDYWAIRLNGTGTMLWQNTIGGNGSDYMQSIIQTADGDYFCGGRSISNISGEKTENNQGDDDYWVLKLTDSLTTINHPNFIYDFSVYPNPTNNDVKISLNLKLDAIVEMNLCNAMGQVVKTSTGKFSSGKHEVSLPVSECADGVYYIKLSVDGNVAVRKMVKM